MFGKIGIGTSKTFSQNNANSLEIGYNQHKVNDCRNSSFFCLSVMCFFTFLAKVKAKMH